MKTRKDDDDDENDDDDDDTEGDDDDVDKQLPRAKCLSVSLKDIRILVAR